ncbi:MAG: SGNH/GDSL hydrolase family protein [Limnospira sp. PMC 1291.21]|uniref:Esterase, SGNH hydrolase-like n=3 Tax=Limnospira TaxID=2596745 RepID=A0A9P1KAK0_9CYAN|nr:MULTISPECIES: SGNH/GDSL hydrolase family protein [Limnospira]EKD09867.1 lipolytic protein G-D-S-L family [Arthrospira platensis C1]MDC0838936.1 SGNH/GDSL hydrolase family protein [Limnoraphis robusta]MDY7051966.1 SGNH/GDSL hydrolase family protein [Limnospira fusiformis LS22]QJB28817.1 SGNH/GDSL hydrolase family protein [Limnospira fusiformis SAG 85.79]EDZ93000.1 lipolytic protein G-D-S-L family [Limnospira maxima CS-328]
MVKILVIVIVGVLGAIALLELGLRVFFGFGNPLIYVSDEEIGYLLAGDQSSRRFGNRIEINQYSMRSHAIAPTPEDNTLRIMLLGDSIANGGWWTDQDDTISAMMTQQLQSQLPVKQVEVLNVSANSWGPPNQLAYVQKFGLFGSQILVLLLNTDDLFARIPNPHIVGRDRNYPDQKPPLALLELFNRYLGRDQPIPPPSRPRPQDVVAYNLDMIRELNAIALQQGAQFLLLMTPLLREIGEPGPKDYELKARSRLQSLTQQENIKFIDFLPPFNSHPDSPSLYRDHIHLSPQGNQLVNELLLEQLNL